MSNVLADEKRQQILALGRLGWSLRRIEQTTGVRRETASGYLKAAGLGVRGRGRPRSRPAKPAISSVVSTDSHAAHPVTTGAVSTAPTTPLRPGRAPSASACEPYRELIVEALGRGRNAMAIWQDLVDDYGFGARYASVRRFVARLRDQPAVEARVVITTAPGEEAQVDYGDGPMVRDRATGKHRRTRLFVLTLGYSRKAIRFLVWRSSAQVWAELHERAFRRLGGTVRVVVLDNLKEGVLTPDVYDPTLNPLYRDVLAHYGAVALPCRVGDPDRKGKVEAGVGHAKKTPLRGLRFERLAEAQAYLDRWETRWADTRIHGTTKRQVAAMFAEERPALGPLPLEPFRYYQYGQRTVHLDGCVEVAAAYYGAPPGWIGRRVHVQWNAAQVIRRRASSSASICASRAAGIGSRTPTARPGPRSRRWRCWPRASGPARRSARSATTSIGTTAPPGSAASSASWRSPRNMAPLSWKTPPPPRSTSASPPTASCGAISTGPPLVAPGRPAHPATHALSRSHRSQNRRPVMNLVELDQALRKLRLSGMADTLDTRLQHAQTEPLAPIDLVSALVTDELQRRQDRLLARRHKQAGFRDPDRALDSFDFTFNKKMNRALVYDLATARFIAQREDALLLGPPGTGKSHLAQAIGRAAIHQGYRVLYREAHTLLEELAEATLADTRKAYLTELTRVPLLIIDDLGMRKLPHTAAEDLLELIMRRYERASTLLTSNRPVDDWGKLLGDTAAVTALLDRLLHHAHVLKCGPRSWRTKVTTTLRSEGAVR